MNANFEKWNQALIHGDSTDLCESLREAIEVIEKCLELINKNRHVLAEVLQTK
jgi:hypothetical protein